mmetsp:Transcript_13759/g.22766  ORF Transcript_13759/g.22766 Transcript_13759/m.22766 type:complete len:796 (-) Transcript_13759:109-2496(-)
MLRLIFKLGISLPLCAAELASTTSYVDGFIGTTYFEGTTDLGQTIPQVGVPFAHSPFTPDTTTIEEHCKAPYYYHDEQWRGMRKTHWTSGSCVLDYGSITVIPSLTLDINEAMTYHSLNHSQESWSPALYEMNLAESGIRVEATNDNRAGLIRFDLSNMRSDSSSLYIIVMSFDTEYNQSYVTAQSSTQALLSNPVHRYYQGAGHSAGFSGHHSLHFSEKAKSYGIIQGYDVPTWASAGESLDGFSDRHGPVAVFYEFDRGQVSEVVMAAGSSFVSRDKAEQNLQGEFSGSNSMFDVETVVGRVTRRWEETLSVVKVSDDPKRVDFDSEAADVTLTQFYTAMWHSLLLPRMAADHDGEYVSFAGGKEVVQGRADPDGAYWYHDDYSMWDTYRATVPLQFLVVPELVPDLVHSLVAKSDQGGWLPMFPVWNSYTQEMIGDHCGVLIGDAYQKGLMNEQSSELAHKAYIAMRKNALEVPTAKEYLQGKGRRAIKEYLKNGFVPLEATMPLTFHDREQVSRTMEYAYNDYVVAQLALKLGFQSDYEQLLANSDSYKMVIDDTGVGFPRGRHVNLTWDLEDDEFDPDASYEWLTEASAYQYAWYVPHRVEELVQLYGGGEAFAEKLNTFFDDGHYNHGNEPDHQAVFMYAYLANTPDEGAWRIQDRVRTITDSFYTDGPGGLAGNDDAGQISSWYVLASMGLYQVCPGCGGRSEYVLTTPLFDSTTLTISQDVSFTVTARKDTAADIYIQSATLDGVKYDCAFVPHHRIVSGGVMNFKLGPTPNKAWGSGGRACLDEYF